MHGIIIQNNINLNQEDIHFGMLFQETRSSQPTMNSNQSHEDDESFLPTLELVNGTLVILTINAAMDLDIFGIIGRAGGPKAHISATEIASHFPKHNPNTASVLDAMLRVLVTRRFLTCSTRALHDGSPERVYGLAPAARYLAKDSGEGSLAPMFVLAKHKAPIALFENVNDVLTGGGDRKPGGFAMYEAAGKDPMLNEVFGSSMAGISGIAMAKILKVYKGFEGLTSLADVGGGKGRTLSMVISKYPYIKGFNFDVPCVIQTAPPYPGIEHVAGDMFVSVPRADAIMMKDVIHNWSDEFCLKILKNCYKALPKGGKAVIITMIPQEVPDSCSASRYLADVDYVMLLQGSGKERGEKELEGLCMASGFSKFQVACSAYGLWSVVEFHV